MQEKKSSKNFQRERQTPKRKKIDPLSVHNLIYRGTRISLLGDAELAAWNAMTREEKRKHIKNIDLAIQKKKFKPLDITFDYKGMEVTKMIYVPFDYNGTGNELLILNYG